MYHVSVQGIDERMINDKMYIIIITLLVKIRIRSAYTRWKISNWSDVPAVILFDWL